VIEAGGGWGQASPRGVRASRMPSPRPEGGNYCTDFFAPSGQQYVQDTEGSAEGKESLQPRMHPDSAGELVQTNSGLLLPLAFASAILFLIPHNLGRAPQLASGR
jgi:hypothetical protein